MDLYGRERRLARAETLVHQSSISQQDKDLIFEFETWLFSQSLSPLRVQKYLIVLRIFAEEMNMPLKEATRSNIIGFFAALNRSDKQSWTKRDYYIFIKRFYRWLGKNALVADLKLPRGRSKAPHLLTSSDIEIIVKRTPHCREKAMIAGLYDLGARCGEWFADLRVGDFLFEDYVEETPVLIERDLYQMRRVQKTVCSVSLFGKTGARVEQFELPNSAALIRDWLGQHPRKNDPRAPVWVDAKGELLFRSYEQVRDYVSRIVAHAGITKHITFQSFRHGRMTEMDDAIRTTMMKKRHGTSQLKTYIHPEMARRGSRALARM